MKKTFFSLIFLFPIVISNQSTSKIESVTKTQVNGGNTSVSAEVTNIVNQNEVRVRSQKEGEIKIETKNGQTTIETTDDSIEIITPSPASEVVIEPTMIEANNQSLDETENFMANIQKQITEIIQNIFSRISLIGK